MLLANCIPLSLLLLLPFVSTTQTPFDATAPTAQSTTLIDVLNADKDYTSLLQLLQLARLIPTINKLNGSTLFAPTNDAIERHGLWQTALSEPDPSMQDNIHEKLRQELFYHLLNYSLPVLPVEHGPQVLKTLHFPRKPLDPPSREPPPQPPWMPTPGGTLGGEPQRLRVASREDGVWVGVNAFGEGGASVVKGKIDAGNGALLGIGEVLQVPPDLGMNLLHVAACLLPMPVFQRLSSPASLLWVISTGSYRQPLLQC